MFSSKTFIAAAGVGLLAAGLTLANEEKDAKSEAEHQAPKHPKALVIKGKVIGDDGKPQSDAEIRVKPLDGNAKTPESVVITDSAGKYIVLGLTFGDYAV